VYSTYGAQLEPDSASFRTALNWIARKEIDVTRMVTHRVPIEQIDGALRIALERTDGALKVAVTF